ncbi:MAG: hypothetical protein ABSH08_20290 [Tepidisphaeraceae bacterium]|jgi:hypothetical protein
MKDWKTTVAGILTIISACCASGMAFMNGHVEVGVTALTTGIPMGVGLIKAADSKPAK